MGLDDTYEPVVFDQRGHLIFFSGVGYQKGPPMFLGSLFQLIGFLFRNKARKI